MKRIRVLASIAVLVTLPDPGRAEGGNIPGVLPRMLSDAEIGQLIEHGMVDRQGAGMVVGVARPDGDRVFARGPVGTDVFDGRTVFEIGSVSKIFTALLLADMVRRGEVKLDEPARNLLPKGARMPAGGGDKITLGDLATHRSGLPRLPDNVPGADVNDPYATFSEAELLAFLRRYQLNRAPGSRYEYSNLGMGLLGYLLGRRAGTDYATLVRDRITGPLVMNDTGVALSRDQTARMATGRDSAMHPAKPWNMAILPGAGGLRSTVYDMLRLLHGFTGRVSTPLRRAMSMMLARQWPAAEPGQTTGLGWLVVQGEAGEIAWHDGATGGFRATLAWSPLRRSGVIVLTNTAAGPSTDEIAFDILAGH